MDEEVVITAPTEETDIAPVETPTEVVESTPQISEMERQAREQGWRPKEEWEGDESKWRDAKEFVERGELYGKIDTLGRDLKETKKALKMLQEHHSKVKETEFANAIAELKGLQRKHLEDGDSEKYLETTELLTDLKAEQKAREVFQEVTPKQPDPRFIAWVDTNKWYSSNQEMREYADIVGMAYAKNNPGIDPTEVLEHVTKKVREIYKDKFVNPNRAKPTSVESGGTTATTPKTSTYQFTDDERKVFNTFKRQGIIGPDGMSEKDYIDEIKKMKGLA